LPPPRDGTVGAAPGAGTICPDDTVGACCIGWCGGGLGCVGGAEPMPGQLC
jgi:hypothetical protein